jgi:hypothetical protein
MHQQTIADLMRQNTQYYHSIQYKFFDFCPTKWYRINSIGKKRGVSSHRVGGLATFFSIANRLIKCYQRREAIQLNLIKHKYDSLISFLSHHNYIQVYFINIMGTKRHLILMIFDVMIITHESWNLYNIIPFSHRVERIMHVLWRRLLKPHCIRCCHFKCTRSYLKAASTHCWRQRHSVTALATYAMTLVTALMRDDVTRIC